MKELIEPRHLQRLAIVYVRQSSDKQILNNPESPLRQRALQTRAAELGWPSERILLLQEERGESASSTCRRHAASSASMPSMQCRRRISHPRASRSKLSRSACATSGMTGRASARTVAAAARLPAARPPAVRPIGAVMRSTPAPLATSMTSNAVAFVGDITPVIAVVFVAQWLTLDIRAGILMRCDVAVIGAGPAGLDALRHHRRSPLSHLSRLPRRGR